MCIQLSGPFVNTNQGTLAPTSPVSFRAHDDHIPKAIACSDIGPVPIDFADLVGRCSSVQPRPPVHRLSTPDRRRSDLGEAFACGDKARAPCLLYPAPSACGHGQQRTG